MARGFGGQVRFAVENYGDSALARRFGVTRYPAIFVNDVLVATPKDFGFYGKGEGEKNGRYAPLRSATSHERFRADLTRMLELVLAGRNAEARASAANPAAGELEALPDLTLKDVDGKQITRADLAGHVVALELWATWCPPCRGTLKLLADLKRRHGDRLVVLALALESDPADVKKVAAELDAPVVFAMATPELVRALGDVSAVPTLHLFGRDGKRVVTHFGAPPTLHAAVEARISTLLR